MRARWTVGASAALVALTLATPASAVSISVPSSVSLGTTTTGAGGTLSAQLGPVTVTATGLVAPSFAATVTSTTFTTGAKTANETIGKTSIFYWSGPVMQSGLSLTTPGQPTAANAVDLSTTRPACSGTGVLLSISATWNPTIVVHVPAAAVVGTYSGTITHSVA
jgi:hypothetical protein